MLAYYGQRLESVEVNTTFYRNPTADTIAGWNGFEIRNAGSWRSPVRKRSG